IRIVSGVSLSAASSDPSSSDSIATVIFRSSPERELRKVFFRIRNIHPRKLVVGLMQNCVEPFDKSLVRDPRHRSDFAQASVQSCKGNQTGAWPTLRTPPTICRPARMESRIGLPLVSQIHYASFALSRISSKTQSQLG